MFYTLVAKGVDLDIQTPFFNASLIALSSYGGCLQMSSMAILSFKA
jgi:hypothetical protein